MEFYRARGDISETGWGLKSDKGMGIAVIPQ